MHIHDPWLKLMHGPLWISPERINTLKKQVKESTISAIDLMRNYKRLGEECDPKELGRAISRCSYPQAVPPYLYYMAEKITPIHREELHDCLLRSRRGPQAGHAAVMVDVSAGMYQPAGEGLTRLEIAASYAVTMTYPQKRLFTVSDNIVEVPQADGLGGIDRITMAQRPGCQFMRQACRDILRFGNFSHLVVFTDKIFYEPLPAELHVVTQPGQYLLRPDVPFQKKFMVQGNSTIH